MTEQGKAPAALTATHTPGPWLAHKSGRTMWIVAVEPLSTILHTRAEVYGPPGVVEHDAKLIAAAPSLADALEQVAIPTLRYCEERFGLDDQARVNLEASLRLAGRGGLK